MRRQGAGPRGGRRAAGAAIVLASLACAAAGGETVVETVTPHVREAVERLRAAPHAEKATQDDVRARLTEFADSTVRVRAWLEENESIAGVYKTDPPRAPHWGPNQDYANAWNDLLSVAHFHQAAPQKERYLVRERKPGYRHLRAAWPVSARWEMKYPEEDQKSAVLTQSTFGGKVLRTLTFWVYRWDTNYSGVGGENCQKLAEVLWKAERDLFAERARDASRGVEIRPLNGKIPRAYYYFVRGPNPEDGREQRIRTWHFKGRAHTFGLELEEELDPARAPTDLDRWQQGESDPETAAVLDSIAFADPP